MKNWTTSKGAKIYQVLKGTNKVFLIIQNDKKILVDSGKNNKWKRLQKNLSKLKINQIDYLILTHAHYDHVENAARIQKKFKALIINHKSDTNNLQIGVTQIPKGTNFFTRFLTNFGAEKLDFVKKFEPSETNIEINYFLDLKQFGLDAQIIHTPGHSTGSISIIINNEIAIVGDAMFGFFKNSIFPPFADDINLMKQSWIKLFNTNCTIFLPSHGSAISRILVEKELETHKRAEK